MISLRLKVLVMLAFAAYLLPGNHLWGQQQGEPSRADRIKEHQDRIQKIIEESRKRREEQQKASGAQAAQPPAAPGTAPGNAAAGSPAGNAAGAGAVTGAAPPVASRPGQPLPTGPVQNARLAPPVQKAQPTPVAAAPQTARSESRTIMLFHPIDSIVSVGERFKTDIVAETKEGVVDEISFLLKYPRHILNPLGLDHGNLDPFVQDKIDYEFNPDDGTIYVHARLHEPTRFAQKAVASIVWEALEPSDGSVISYEFGEKKTTGLYLKGSNLLGTLPGAEDGVIRTTVQVTAPKSKATVTKLADKGLLIGAEPQKSRDDRPGDEIKVGLKTSKSFVRAGEEFDVAVILDNPGEKLIDRVQLYIQFNPRELETVDNDLGNVVTRGVNIHDAPSRSIFPFDYYRVNSADNKNGLITYEVSASNSGVRGTGPIATIRLKALKDTPRADIVLVQNGPGLSPTTEVSFLGESRLAKPSSELARSLSGISVQVNGRVEATQAGSKTQQYNPFESDLARRMQSRND